MKIDSDMSVSGNFRITADVISKYRNVLFIDASMEEKYSGTLSVNSAIAVVNTINGHFVGESSELIHAKSNDEAEMLALLFALNQSKDHKDTTLIVSDSRHAVRSAVMPMLPHAMPIYHEVAEKYVALSEQIDIAFAPRNSHAFQARADYVAGFTRTGRAVNSYAGWLRGFGQYMSMPYIAKKVSFEGIKNMPKIKHRKSVLMRWAQEAATAPATTPQEAAE